MLDAFGFVQSLYHVCIDGFLKHCTLYTYSITPSLSLYPMELSYAAEAEAAGWMNEWMDGDGRVSVCRVD